MRTPRPPRVRHLVAACGLAALVGATLASAPVAAESQPTGGPGEPVAPTGPIAPAVDSVTWDEDGDGDAVGDDDQLSPPGGPSAYSLNDYAWQRTDLTYAVEVWTPDLATSQTSAAVASAFDTWASVTPLTFTAVAPCGLAFNHGSCTTPDIRIIFGAGDHNGGGGDPDFDGPGGVIGHAYGPVPDSWNFTAGGDIHLDEAETWRVDGGGLDLETVFLHESGHALGLGHTNQSCAAPAGPSRPIMCPVLTGTQRVLSADDLAGIQALYGAAPVDLPDGVSAQIIGAGARSTGAWQDYVLRLTNGYDNDLENASLAVAGVPGCDRGDLTIPANDHIDALCTVIRTNHLKNLDTSERVTMTATLSASGVADTVAGPIAIDILPADHRFWDVPGWVDTSVDWIAYWGLADGYPDGSYRPNSSITRAQVTRMIWRYSGSPAGGGHSLVDVPAWVAAAVNWAAYNPPGPTTGFMSGYPDRTFRPNNPMTRSEVVRLMYRLAGSPSVAGLPGHGFWDVPSWVNDAVTWAAHDPDGAGPLKPVVNGYPDGSFRGNNHVTRAELTRALYRLTDQLID
jgi:hypothetical protein